MAGAATVSSSAWFLTNATTASAAPGSAGGLASGVATGRHVPAPPTRRPLARLDLQLGGDVHAVKLTSIARPAAMARGGSDGASLACGGPESLAAYGGSGGRPAETTSRRKRMAQARLGGTFTLAPDLTVHRMGYGAMQLAGPGVVRAARRPGRGRRRAARGGRARHQPHRHQRLLRPVRHQPDHQGGAAPVPGRPAHRHQGRRAPRRRGRLAPGPCARPAPPGRRTTTCDHLGLDALDVVNLRLGGFDGPEPARSPSRSARWPSCSRRA